MEQPPSKGSRIATFPGLPLLLATFAIKIVEALADHPPNGAVLTKYVVLTVALEPCCRVRVFHVQLRWEGAVGDSRAQEPCLYMGFVLQGSEMNLRLLEGKTSPIRICPRCIANGGFLPSSVFMPLLLTPEALKKQELHL